MSQRHFVSDDRCASPSIIFLNEFLRPNVRFVDSPDLAYIMTRYREVHDFWHVLSGLDTTVLDELGLKVFEFLQTGIFADFFPDFVLCRTPQLCSERNRRPSCPPISDAAHDLFNGIRSVGVQTKRKHMLFNECEVRKLFGRSFGFCEGNVGIQSSSTKAICWGVPCGKSTKTINLLS